MRKIKYKIPDGLAVSEFGHSRSVRSIDGDAYQIADLEEGTKEVWSYNEVINLIKMSGARHKQTQPAMTLSAARIRDGVLQYRHQLSKRQNDIIDFRKALMFGIMKLHESGKRIYQVGLDQTENRRFIADIARQYYSRRPISDKVRGGSVKSAAFMPQGRTIFLYWKRWVDADFDDMALADHDWKKGNRSNHGISTRMRELMTQASEETYMDSRKPNVASALRRLKTLVNKENNFRIPSELEPLVPVCHKTLSEHIKQVGATALSIARNGADWVANNRSRGQTDVRALMIGEMVEIDECKMSLITVCKKKGWWQKLSEGEKTALSEIEEIIRKRLWLVLMIDVATRMPLAWVITDAPSKEATLELFRMATRSKHKEKVIYRCKEDPMPAVGVGCVKGDNGSGQRNANVKAAALGVFAQTIDARTYHGIDKPHIERMFGTLESVLLNIIHGYTGRKAGQLKNYDPIKNGVLEVDELYGLITRYLIDEYPLDRHYGTNMWGARPQKVFERVNEECNAILPPSDHERRIHLGWKDECTLTDEGVKALELPYQCDELQEISDKIQRKVTVFSDPDCVNEITILVQGYPEPFLGRLSLTSMKDLSATEAINIIAKMRAEDPSETQDFEARLARVRGERFDHMASVALENKLPCSYTTFAAAKAKAEIVMRGQHTHSAKIPGATPPGMVAQAGNVEGVRKVGDGFQPAIDGIRNEVQTTEPKSDDIDFGKPDIRGKLK